VSGLYTKAGKLILGNNKLSFFLIGGETNDQIITSNEEKVLYIDFHISTYL